MLLGLVDFERFKGRNKPRGKFDLRRMKALLETLGNPERDVPTVHIAGTKGKGSTAALVTSVLASQGYNVGTYTSPHLHTFRERIAINGIPISEKAFCSLLEKVWIQIEKLDVSNMGNVTVFEALTAMAFLHFHEVNSDFHVLEVGLGGRLDSTNVVSPMVCVITSLSLDHTAILGETIEQIAQEKAGIIKFGTKVISARQDPKAMKEIRNICAIKSSFLTEVGSDIIYESGQYNLKGQSFRVRSKRNNYDLWMPLLGDHQLENAAIAVGVVEAVTEEGWSIDARALETGFMNVSWPCRMEALEENPLVIADGAHNPDAMTKVREFAMKYLKGRRPVVIFGASKDKNVAGMMDELVPLNPIIISTRARHPRYVNVEDLTLGFRSRGLEVFEGKNVPEAMKIAKAVRKGEDYVLATGSLFVAAEVREVVLNINPEVYNLSQISSSVTPGNGRSV